MSKRSAAPLTCTLCRKQVPPNETWKHIEADHKEQKGSLKGMAIAALYERGVERYLAGTAKKVIGMRGRNGA
jgi:hypothetical protein